MLGEPIPDGFMLNEEGLDYFAKVQVKWHTWFIDDSYRWCLLLLVLIAMDYLWCVMVIMCYKRNKLLPKEFMEKEFGDEHKNAGCGDIMAGGYPDMGSGRYVMRAGYKVWMEINKDKRICENYLEHI